MSKLDYKNINKAEAIPEADAMIETFRAIGYTLETAVADIIDNSIAAGAENVWITREWKGDATTFCIKDDGKGMDSKECIQAMKPGSKNPLSEREEADLGRFGLGLKTASFSQCRRLTLISKKKGCEQACWTWDLDYVGEAKKWEVLQWAPSEYKNILKNVDSGTAVIWSQMDRVIPVGTQEDDENAYQKFCDGLDYMLRHVEMTFHRFMEDEELTIYYGDTPLKPWDPFCMSEKKTQECSLDEIPFEDRIVNIRGFVLPHKDDFSTPEAHKKAGGIREWLDMQGFYVYRGKRLLLAGDWLGLFHKEEHNKLVRILIDLPNNLDEDWQIDIKKSTAIVPLFCREFLRGYARNIRKIGVEVFRHKGRIIEHRAGSKFQSMWNEKKVGNKSYFVINRNHSFVHYLKDMAKEQPEKAIDMLMNFIEESIPSKSIYIKEAEGEDSTEHELSPTMLKNLKLMAQTIYEKKRKDGTPAEVVKAELKLMQPYNIYTDIVDSLHD